MNSRRLEGTRRFLERAGQSWSPVAWVNPMPERRWAGTTAERIAALPEVAMVEWNESGLIAAVDMLRGLKG